ncbi:class I SAM-dependent methyltransferase [Chroococcidiopsis sp. TS-821]|uniref:class I SAM-dependent methyltransferase n=1 Tax=Chroococcidiopsis sp. TS-821 TaxID=1378066 RepID=UPI000CEE4ED1|nr:class I SAM-dependent methyltransferase [Chroococcidiopsis sp. TS-821]PPS45551.1 hypothetical protein B1A85_04695 [Chroococcidiopsis sp. TS-821]
MLLYSKQNKIENKSNITSSKKSSNDLNLKTLNKILVCPCDQSELLPQHYGLICKACSLKFSRSGIDSKSNPLDFRCNNQTAKVRIEFQIPQPFLTEQEIQKLGYATNINYKCISREQIRNKYQTKLQKEILYYIDKIKTEFGTDLTVLDLGCGSGGNKKYLNSVGITHVISADYSSDKADILVDVHRLPFKNSSFDFVLTTATIEHFYNPFIAFTEINRVLKPGGALIASGSFWESWHDQSCFHFTPNGFFILCNSVGLTLEDLWSGWGFIPSISSHALNLRKFKKYTYKLQDLFDAFLRLRRGNDFAFRHRLQTSGSFGIYARKKKLPI